MRRLTFPDRSLTEGQSNCLGFDAGTRITTTILPKYLGFNLFLNMKQNVHDVYFFYWSILQFERALKIYHEFQIIKLRNPTRHKTSPTPAMALLYKFILSKILQILF